MLADAFKGHGTFFYSAEHTLRKYDNDPAKLVAAMQEAGMSHGWVRLHSWNKTTNQPKVEPYQPTLKLVTALKDAGIAGVISYALWELGFWTVSVPVCIFAYRSVTGHWPDFSNREELFPHELTRRKATV